MDALQPVVDRDRRAFHSHCVNSDVLGQKHFQRVFVTGDRALLKSVADDEDDFPPRPVALGKIARRQQDRVIHTRATFGGVLTGFTGESIGSPLIDRSLRPERPARHRRSIICSAEPFDLVQSRRQLLAHGGEV